MGLVKLLKQRDTGKLWGFSMQIIQQEAVVIQGLILLSSLVTTSSILQIRGYEIPVWILIIIVVVIIVLGGVAVYVLGMPSYFSAFNDQFYRHNNPMRIDIEKLQSNDEELKKQVAVFLKNQKMIMDKLGIGDGKNED